MQQLIFLFGRSTSLIGMFFFSCLFFYLLLVLVFVYFFFFFSSFEDKFDINGDLPFMVSSQPSRGKKKGGKGRKVEKGKKGLFLI